MKVRGIQFSPKLGNVKANMDFHVQQIKQAITDKIDLIIFPELSITGYQLKDLVSDVSLNPDDSILNTLRELSTQINIVFGAPYEEVPGIIHNCAFYLANGKLVHLHRKVQLPNFGMFSEAKIFKAGSKFEVFKINGYKLGLLICREILFPVHAYLYFQQQADFIIGISNSPHRDINDQGFTSFKMWETMGDVFALFFQLHYVFVNRSGFEDGVGFGGGSFFARAGRGIEKKAAYMEDDRLDVTVDLADVRRARLSGNYLRDDNPELIYNELSRILNVRS